MIRWEQKLREEPLGKGSTALPAERTKGGLGEPRV